MPDLSVGYTYRGGDAGTGNGGSCYYDVDNSTLTRKEPSPSECVRPNP